MPIDSVLYDVAYWHSYTQGGGDATHTRDGRPYIPCTVFAGAGIAVNITP